MRVFERLRALRTFEKQHLGFLRTIEDHNLVREIGYHQAEGIPLTLKQLFLLDIGSVATVQRRLRRLKNLGVVHQRRSSSDRRAVELRLRPKAMHALEKYRGLFATATGISIAECHACGIYDTEQGRHRLITSFLDEGIKQGERCVLIAGPEVREAVAAALGPRRKNFFSADYAGDADSQLDFWKQQIASARASGQRLRFVGDTTRAQARGMDDDMLYRYEKALDAMLAHANVRGLCLYDARKFSARGLLQALRCHRDTARYPLPLA